MDYTAEQMVKKLKDEENILISVRTLNYYAYDKKMFPQLKKGKSCYSDNEYELLRRIAFLKEKSSMTLEEIKNCIFDDEKYNVVVETIMEDTVDRCSKSYARSVDRCCNYATSTTDYLQSLNSVQGCEPNCSAQSYSETENSQFWEQNNSLTQATYCIDTNSTGGFVSQTKSNMHYSDSLSMQTPAKENTTTVRINKDVTITVSKNISRERLIEIVNFINKN